MKLISQGELAKELAVSTRTVYRRRKELVMGECRDIENDARKVGFNKAQSLCIAQMTLSCKSRLPVIMQNLNSYFAQLPALVGVSGLVYEKKDFRMKEINGETWFCLKDVCDILGIAQPTRVAERLNQKGVNSNHTLTRGGKQEMLFINEPNLYRVIFQSRKDEAVQFQDWVFEVVIPQIRQHGSYNTKQLTK